MTKQVTVDIETLDTRARSIVLSIGYSFFDPMEEEPFEAIVERGEEIFFDIQSQKDKGRTWSQSTLDWWSEQGSDAQRCLAADVVIPIRQFHDTFEAFCERNNVNVNWAKKHAKWVCRGPHFDISILQDLFEDFNVSTPWRYYNVRDIRTWLECRGLPDNLKLTKPSSMIPHNALHDAAFDAWMMQQLNNHPLDELDVDA